MRIFTPSYSPVYSRALQLNVKTVRPQHPDTTLCGRTGTLEARPAQRIPKRVAPEIYRGYAYGPRSEIPFPEGLLRGRALVDVLSLLPLLPVPNVRQTARTTLPARFARNSV